MKQPLTFLQYLEEQIASSLEDRDDSLPDKVADYIENMDEANLFFNRISYSQYIHNYYATIDWEESSDLISPDTFYTLNKAMSTMFNY